LNKCKDCAKRDSREWYRETRPSRLAYERERNRSEERKLKALETQRRMREKYPEKYRARTAVSNAIRDGKLLREPCSGCGKTGRIHAHHDDYSKPLDVVWLCEMCHRAREGRTV